MSSSSLLLFPTCCLSLSFPLFFLLHSIASAAVREHYVPSLWIFIFCFASSNFNTYNSIFIYLETITDIRHLFFFLRFFNFPFIFIYFFFCGSLELLLKSFSLLYISLKAVGKWRCLKGFQDVVKWAKNFFSFNRWI